MGGLILNIINWFLALATWIVSLMVICGGVKYFLVRGNKEKESKALRMFIYGLLGLFVLGFIFIISVISTPSPFTGSIL